MEDSRRRAYIKQQATVKKKQEGSLPPKGTGPVNLSTKRKLFDKVNCPPKKPKVVTRLVIGETLDTSKLPPMPGSGKGKGLMTGHVSVTKERPILLHKDSRYVLKQLSSIIKDDNYADLGNHATKAMGETGLFNLAQICLSILFLYFILLLSHSNLCF